MSSTQPRRATPRWPIGAMIASWILGIVWIVLFYLDPTLPVLSGLGNWNLLAGFALLLLGGAFLLLFAVMAIVKARRQ
ncbi:cell division protein CrgA [Nonomuraea sp. NPDC050404]|uniref:cell division protein CrgA n=1 Tax=Nonomuraea sp. NPDC050404 TaxID=3155783 RepID=UPI0033DBB690